MTSDILQYFNPITFGSISCDVTHGNFKLRYLEFWKMDTEMVDHFLNPKFSGAPYDLCYFLIKARKNKKKI